MPFEGNPDALRFSGLRWSLFFRRCVIARFLEFRQPFRPVHRAGFEALFHVGEHVAPMSRWRSVSTSATTPPPWSPAPVWEMKIAKAAGLDLCVLAERPRAAGHEMAGGHCRRCAARGAGAGGGCAYRQAQNPVGAPLGAIPTALLEPSSRPGALLQTCRNGRILRENRRLLLLCPDHEPAAPPS